MLNRIPRSLKARRKCKPRGRPLAAGHQWRWKPGQSGNPAGRRRGLGPSWSALIYWMLAQPCPADPDQALRDLIDAGASIGHVIVFGLGLLACAGDLEAVKLIAGRQEARRDRHGPRPPEILESMTADIPYAFSAGGGDISTLGTPSEFGWQGRPALPITQSSDTTAFTPNSG